MPFGYITTIDKDYYLTGKQSEDYFFRHWVAAAILDGTIPLADLKKALNYESRELPPDEDGTVKFEIKFGIPTEPVLSGQLPGSE